MDYSNDDTTEEDLGSLASELSDDVEAKWKSSRSKTSGAERRNAGHLWLISYADFMTIMMIFFLGLYGYTVLAKSALMAQKKPTQSLSEFAAEVQQLKAQLGDKVQVTKGVNKVTVQLSDDILFASGQAVPQTQAEEVLSKLASSLKQTEGTIVVQGHTDNIPIRGGHYPSNWELSAARSMRVIDLLTANGIPTERLSAWGFGENRPIVPNTSEENRARNRRIEIVILKVAEKRGGV